MPKHKLTTVIDSKGDVAALQNIAKRLGFIQPVGGGAGQGSIGGLIQAIARLSDEQVVELAKVLRVEAPGEFGADS